MRNDSTLTGGSLLHSGLANPAGCKCGVALTTPQSRKTNPPVPAHSRAGTGGVLSACCLLLTSFLTPRWKDTLHRDDEGDDEVRHHVVVRKTCTGHS
jgi:hypothetical protein